MRLRMGMIAESTSDDAAWPIGREREDAGEFGTTLRSPRYWHVLLLILLCRVHNICGG